MNSFRFCLTFLNLLGNKQDKWIFTISHAPGKVVVNRLYIKGKQ